MSRLDIMTPSRAQTVIDGLYRDYLGEPLGEKSHHLLHTDHFAWELPRVLKK